MVKYKAMFDKQFNPAETQKSLDDLGPLYHSYRLLGVKNQQRPGIFLSKSGLQRTSNLSYILLALAKCKTSRDVSFTFAELFYTDGYYAAHAISGLRLHWEFIIICLVICQLQK